MMRELISFPDSVEIIEVGPRDGLQNLESFVPTATKVDFINMIKKAGLKIIEVTSFVNPKSVPQMQDAPEILSMLKNDDITFKVLVPNRRGLERAAKAGARDVVAVLSASETHNKNNVNLTIDESLAELKALAALAREARMTVRANIATAFGCEFEGRIPIEKVIKISKTLEDAGYKMITLCDTTGLANPTLAFDLCRQMINTFQNITVGVHFHRCDGIEFANVLASLVAGVRTFEAACGGLGGCPFAPGATGNIATEHLVELFNRMNIKTGVDLTAIKACAEFALKIQDIYSGAICSQS